METQMNLTAALLYTRQELLFFLLTDQYEDNKQESTWEWLEIKAASYSSKAYGGKQGVNSRTIGFGSIYVSCLGCLSSSAIFANKSCESYWTDWIDFLQHQLIIKAKKKEFKVEVKLKDENECQLSVETEKEEQNKIPLSSLCFVFLTVTLAFLDMNNIWSQQLSCRATGEIETVSCKTCSRLAVLTHESDSKPREKNSCCSDRTRDDAVKPTRDLVMKGMPTSHLLFLYLSVLFSFSLTNKTRESVTVMHSINNNRCAHTSSHKLNASMDGLKQVYKE